MTDPRTMTTSALVKLIAVGARTEEEQEAAERELDDRLPAPHEHVWHPPDSGFARCWYCGTRRP